MGKAEVVMYRATGDVLERVAGANPTLFGGQWGCCPPLFDECTDDQIMTLFQGLDAVEPAMRWFGFRKALHVKEKKAYLTYVAPAGTAAGTPGNGLPTTICGPGQRVEMGAPCYIEFCGFGEVRLTSAEMKDGGNNTAWCKERDVFTLDFGQGARRIENDEEWWLAMMGGQMMEMMATRLLTGTKTNVYSCTQIPNDSTGLLELLTQLYPDCPQLSSNIVDWAGNPACDYTLPGGMPGITLNGNPVAGKYASNLYITLREIFRQNLTKIRSTRMLGNKQIEFGDVAILLPDWAIECLINCGICHVVCRDDIVRMDSEAAAMKYDEWLAGRDGFPMVKFDRYWAPLIPFNPPDWTSYDPAMPAKGISGQMENADGTFNLLMLWRGIGGNKGRRFLIPEYNDLSDGTKDTASNGQFQMWMDEQGRCYTISMASEWRWYLDAPYLQTLVTNIQCEHLFDTYNMGKLTAQAVCA